MEIIFHYPPELLQLLVDTIPLLSRSKRDVILFFQGAGVPSSLLSDLTARVKSDPQGINKYEIARVVLTRLNEKGETTLRERREVLRRVVEFEDFSTCWPQDQLKAKGLVAETRRVTGVKDAFTRMAQEKDKEAAERREKLRVAQAERDAHHEAIDEVRGELGALFADVNPQRRGTRFEAVLNKLFGVYGISVRESFSVVDDKAQGVIEQIDGVIELDGDIYLVEAKWLSGPVGVEDVSRHLVRIHSRHSSRGLFMSMTEFTPASLKTCEDALQWTVVTLGLMEELIEMLEQRGDLKAWVKRKVQAAVIDRKPFVRLRLRIP
jgi:hypothetical protein